MLEAVVLVATTLLLLAAARFFYLASTLSRATARQNKRTSSCKTLVILGSGGHTAEMLRLLSGMNLKNYSPRVYVLAGTDKMSREKIERFEKENNLEADVRRIPRAREVHQSYVTSVLSTLLALVYSVPLVCRAWPDLVLCNGPGTCIPVCFSAYLLRFLGLKEIALVYIESVCRVEHLSLSGKLLYYVADRLLVQWPQLQKRYPRAHYIGRIV